MSVLPQFPLRLVLFPTMVLPLHVFELRYRALVHDVLEGDRRFGVVLIEEGSDIGGAEKRSSFGTVARVLEAEELADGRWALVTVGVERFRVTNWLPDDPYPVAEVELWPDEGAGPPDQERFDRVVAKLRRCMALASEAGYNVGPIPDKLAASELGTMQMAAMLPIGPFQKQELLGAADAEARLISVESSIEETLTHVELRLRGG